MNSHKKFFCAALLAALFSVESLAASVTELDYRPIVMQDVRTEGTLIYSDSPEYAAEAGILAEGTVKGKGRLYYYHVNAAGEPMRLVLYAESDKNASVRLTRFLCGTPSRDYITSGRTLSYAELTAPREEIKDISLPAGERVIIAEEKELLRPDFLYTGIAEVETRSPVRFGTALLPADADAAEALAAAVPVPVDSHELRGTFPREVWRESTDAWDIAGGPAALTYGSRDSDDFRMGEDELDGVPREDTGNYGVTVHMRVETKGEGRFALYFNPEGGPYLGAFKVRQGYAPLYFRTDDRKYRGKLLGLGTTEDYISLGTWEAGRPLTVEFLSAGATYLPVRFLFVPCDTIEEKARRVQKERMQE